MIKTMLAAVTTTQTSDPDFANDRRPDRAFQASVVGTGAVTATVLIEASNDGVNYLLVATITLSGTTSASDGYVCNVGWGYMRARLTAISGTGAAVTVALGA